MAKIRKIKINWPLFILLLLSIPAALPLIKSGFYEPHDLHHFADIYQMVRAISSGQMPPRLGPDFSFGYGYPLFNFYYLTPFYLGAFLFFLSGSLIASFKLVFLVSVILSVLGMYLFLREFVGKLPAITGSILFLYTPYRAVEIYVRGAMGEAFALSLLPFVAWGFVKIIKSPNSPKLIGVISLITSVFILSHNYLWALSAPYLALLIIFLIERKKIGESLLKIFGVGLLSLGITAYWWVPAVVEQKLVASTTPFSLIDHFPFIKQLIIPSWGYGSSVWGPGDEMSFQIGVVNLAVVIIFIAILLLKRKLLRGKLQKLAIWALIGFIISFAMMNIRTYPIWKVIPFHDFVQFPWRLLMFTTLFTSVLAAVLVEIISKKRRKLIGIIILGLSIILTFSYFKPSKIFYETDNSLLARFFADRTIEGKKAQVSEMYLQYSDDYLLLSKWSEIRPTTLPVSKIQSQGAEIKNIVEINPVHWKASVGAAEKAKVTFNSYYFPGWLGKIDGQLTNIQSGKPYGQIEMLVPGGEHSIEFFWRETTLRKLSDLTSLIFFLILMGIFVCPLKKKNIN